MLDVIFIDIDCRETRQELSRNGMKPVNKTLDAINVVNELNNSVELRKAFGFKSTLNYLELLRGFFTF